MLGIHEVGDATLARLAIHPDDRLVGAAGVHGVDGQVGNLPLAVLLADGRHPLLDGVLVRARECRVDEVAGVGWRGWIGMRVAYSAMRRTRSMSRGRGPGRSPGEQVHGERHDVDVPGPLSVPNSVPSTRSARPARRARGGYRRARSLCGCRLKMTESGCGWCGRTTRSRPRRRSANTSRRWPAGSR